MRYSNTNCWAYESLNPQLVQNNKTLRMLAIGGVSANHVPRALKVSIIVLSMIPCHDRLTTHSDICVDAMTRID